MLADHHPYHHTVTITLGGFSTLAYLTLVSGGRELEPCRWLSAPDR
jgi:hypothetical protein